MTSDHVAFNESANPPDRDPRHPSSASRRWWLLAAPVGIVVVGAGVLGLTQLRGDSPPTDAGQRPSDTTVSATALDAPAAVAQADIREPLRLFLPDPPEAFAMDWIADPSDANQPGGAAPRGFHLIVLAKPGANFATGGWLAVSSRLMDRFERPRYDPAVEGNIQTPRSFNIGEYRAAGGTTWEGTEMITFGPVNDGFSVSVSSADLDQVTLTAIAALINVDDEGATTLQSSPLLDGYETLGVFPEVYGLSALGEGLYGVGTTSVNYSDSLTGAYMSLRSVVSAIDDPLSVARFFIKDPVETTVHGQPAVTGDIATMQPVGGQPAKAIWVEEGRVVTLVASIAPDELVKVAESTRIATPDEWDELKEDVQARMEAMNGMQPGLPTWLIGVGEMDDGATWVVEGGFDDEGKWLSSTLILGSFGPMMAGGMPLGVDITLPHLTIVPQQQLAMPDAELGISVFSGLVEADAAPGTVLRFTPANGEPSEAPLRMIRPDWPAWAAALAVPGDLAGIVELVAPDGTVLSSDDIEAAVADRGSAQVEGDDSANLPTIVTVPG